MKKKLKVRRETIQALTPQQKLVLGGIACDTYCTDCGHTTTINPTHTVPTV